MTLLMMYKFGPNFMLIPFAKLELFKKQILLTSAFLVFAVFRENKGLNN